VFQFRARDIVEAMSLGWSERDCRAIMLPAQTGRSSMIELAPCDIEEVVRKGSAPKQYQAGRMHQEHCYMDLSALFLCLGSSHALSSICLELRIIEGDAAGLQR
jgi:hypothetical protein